METDQQLAYAEVLRRARARNRSLANLRAALSTTPALLADLEVVVSRDWEVDRTLGGRTPLVQACVDGADADVRELLDAGADVSIYK